MSSSSSGGGGGGGRCNNSSNSSSSSDDDDIYYRITGPQSIDRLEPLLLSSSSFKWKALDSSNTQPISFVWETTCEKSWRERHNSALVLNKLHNTIIIENKSNLAFLQLRMNPDKDIRNYGVLKTYVASSGSLVKQWAYNQWNTDTNKNHDWWVVKASKGNGGRDIFVINNANYHHVLSLLNDNDEYVIQKYVNRPMLWKVVLLL